jgi:hypothetical protein
MIHEDILAQIEESESLDEKVETAVDALESFAEKYHQDILTTLLREMAVAESEGDIQHAFVDSHLNRIVKISNANMKKKQLNILYNNFKEEQVDSHGTEQKTPIDIWLVDNVEKVVKKTTTDTNVNVKYIFHFYDTTKTIESDEHHYSFATLSKKIYKQFDVRTADPSEKSNKGWGDWIESFIAPRKEVDEFPGPRTQVIEELQERIDGSDAYTDIELAYNRRRIHYDDEEDAYNVPSRLITSICEEFGITPEALSSEMKQKGIVSSGGCSTKKQVGDRRPRFWVIPSNFANANIVSEEDEQFDTSRYEGETHV